MGTQSNEIGFFTLNISKAVKKFNVSYLGFATREIDIEGRNYFEIHLQAGLQLKEVVVTALGMQRNNQNLGYAVQKIESNEISDVKSANLIDNLAGRVAGVNVSQGSSGVGSTSVITIIGESSFTNNNPLFVPDGIFFIGKITI